jgi:hypothetical protein
MPFYVIVAISLAQGFFNSLHFSSMNTLAWYRRRCITASARWPR